MNLVFATLAAFAAHALQPPQPDLVGTWVSRHRNGPDVRGTLHVGPDGKLWTAAIAGRSVTFPPPEGEIRFQLGDAEFRGHRSGNRLEGHWIQAGGLTTSFKMASPLTLTREGSGWSGEVVPMEDQLTMFLVVKKAEDGTLKAFYRNPERNLGTLLRLDHLEVNGNDVTAVGTWGGSKKMQTLASGKYDPENKVLSLYDPAGGFTHDFTPLGSEPYDDFHPRPAGEAPYRYAKPADKGDGWKVASPEEVGLSRAAIERFVQMLASLPDESVSDARVHGVLVARHGKLVVEEYFHGFSGDRPHDTRSASKSLTSVLAGIAMRKDSSFRLDTPVYKIMNAGTFPPGLEPVKQSITVENLLNMSSGLDAIDRLDDSPGREDTVEEQKKEPDWLKLTMGLPMAFKPGEKAEYGSMQPNLLGGAIARQTHTWLPDFFRENFAKPLQVTRYYMPIMPLGDAYMGGGMQWMPRDFLKLSQLMLNKGKWNGKEIITEEYAKRCAEPRYKMGDRKYGLLWWEEDYPYQGRSLVAHAAEGNGGQMSMYIPELDLAFVAFGGSYASRGALRMQNEFIPQYVLPMVVGP